MNRHASLTVLHVMLETIRMNIYFGGKAISIYASPGPTFDGNVVPTDSKVTHVTHQFSEAPHYQNMRSSAPRPQNWLLTKMKAQPAKNNPMAYHRYTANNFCKTLLKVLFQQWLGSSNNG